MANRQTRFERLFGDESPEFQSTPFLSDVVPGLIPTDTKFASKELNPRRYAVSGRTLRSPRVRSAHMEFPNPEWEEYKTSPPPNALAGEGRRIISSGDEGQGLEATPSSEAMAKQIGKFMGYQGLAGGLSTIGAGLQLGANTGQIIGAIPGGILSGALNPVGMINTFGGAIAAGAIGQNVDEDARFKGTGGIPQAEATKANLGYSGLIGQLTRNLLSKFSNKIDSPRRRAELAHSVAVLEDARREAEEQDISNDIATFDFSDQDLGLSNLSSPGLKANLRGARRSIGLRSDEYSDYGGYGSEGGGGVGSGGRSGTGGRGGDYGGEGGGYGF